MGSGIHLKRSQEKYGIENFRKEILQVFDNSEDMFSKESELVNEDFIKRDDTYNLKVGGYGGFDYLNNPVLFNNKTHENSHMKEIGKVGTINAKKALQQLKTNKDWCYKNSIAISKGLSQFYENGGKGSFLGKHHSEETKKIMSKKAKIHQKGEGNSQYGTTWIYNIELKISKKIPKGTDIPDGWLKGRKIKF